MEPLQTFLSSLDSQTKYRLSIQPTKGIFILSNSGKREDVKDFSLPVNSLLSSLNDIKTHIELFTPKYNEDEWRKAGDYLSDNLAKSLFKSQTRPFFETLNKLLVWVCEGEYKDGEMPLTADNIDKLTAEIVKIDFSSFTTEHSLLQETFSDSKMRLDRPYNRIVFGAPGTGKTFIINKETEKSFGTIIGVTSKDIWQNISEEIQKSDKTVASLFAIGLKYSPALKAENPKSLKKKFKITYGGAYAINQGIRVVDFFSKLPEYDADKIVAIISEQLEKLKSEHFLMQAGSAAIGFKYSEYFYGKSTGDIISELNLSKTSSQASWIWNGAQSANYYEDDTEEKVTHRYERVTFHPNYSYAQFVGTYKPVQDKNDNTVIRYEYIPGPFMRVYVQSMKAKQAGLDDNFLLIIEEINRANVAAVFGDVFQLLDRKNGVSEYPIAASEDIKKYLKDNGIDDCEELRIPDNMYIWATMNSADQGVFPMDTAFKRRWEFEYIGIDENEDGIKDYDIPLQKKTDGFHEWVKWNDLRHSINDKLTEMKINEDKLLGPYFISEEKLKLVEGKKEDNADEFVKSFKSKVLMYLFEDAVKMRPGDLFNENVIGRLRFSDICKKFDEIGQGIFNFKK